MIMQPPSEDHWPLPGWTIALVVLLGSALLLYVAVF
jgi:hypothetical protein